MPEDQVRIKKQSESSMDTVHCSDGDHYPWGTSLRFEDDMISELGVDTLAVGDVVEVRGFAFVESKSEHNDADGSNKNISIQMTTIKLRRETDDRAEQLYGPNS